MAGIRTPEPITKMAEQLPKAYEQLVQIRADLEKHFKEMQDIEFTVQEGTLLHAANADRQAYRNRGPCGLPLRW